MNDQHASLTVNELIQELITMKERGEILGKAPVYSCTSFYQNVHRLRTVANPDGIEVYLIGYPA